MKKAFLFPGQGSQKVGMVHDLYTRYDAVKKLIHSAGHPYRQCRCLDRT